MMKKKKNKIKFRLAVQADVPGLADMMLDSHRDEIFKDFGETEPEAAVQYFDHLVSQGCVVIASKSGQDIGALAMATYPWFSNKGQTVAQTFFWWVDREHRGNGIGEAIMRESERIAKDTLKADMMVFTVRKDSPGAARLCVERGYKLGESQYYRRL